jgi:hypothetical protein
MKLKLPVALLSYLAFVGCATAPAEQSNSLPINFQTECKSPRNDRFSYRPEFSVGTPVDDWREMNSVSCTTSNNAAIYCNADKSECSYALVDNTLHYQVESKGGNTYRVYGYFESEYGSDVHTKSRKGGGTTEMREHLLDGVKLIASGKQSEQFDVTLRLGEKYFVRGFAESGVTFSVSE